MDILKRYGLFVLIATVPFALVVLPLSSFLMMSLYKVDGANIVRQASLDNYIQFFSNASQVRTFSLTLWLCAKVTMIGVLIGFPIAYFIWQRRGRLRYVLLLAFVLPLFMSYIVKIYTMRSLLGLNGFINQALVGFGALDKPSMMFLYNQTSILLTMSVIFLPFVILPIFLSLERIPRNLLQASADLGAGKWVTFTKVILPLSLPGTVAGALFAFVLALGDFVTPQMVGGPSGFTFGRVIWSQFGLAYNWPLGSAMAAVLFLVALVAIISAGFAARQQRV